MTKQVLVKTINNRLLGIRIADIKCVKGKNNSSCPRTAVNYQYSLLLFFCFTLSSTDHSSDAATVLLFYFMITAAKCCSSQSLPTIFYYCRVLAPANL